ncbi:putative glutathione synthetase [Teratosphaeria destructans]|uniref:Glutathione synthetase n=1 Tax=Teratosphaeria destructans TaxID=418781 RepID=A0A9W7T1Q3_9PEZI|nr:putative glutathione synthetase [Teratosphaeria destructans]
MTTQYRSAEPPDLSPPAERTHGLTEDELIQIIQAIHDYQIVHGNQIKLLFHATEAKVPSIGYNVSVIPTRFSRHCFDHAVKLQPVMNELYMRVAADETWLSKVLAPLLEHDNFLSTLWDIYKQVKAAGIEQDMICGIFRCDYMLHGESHADAELKQVEVNTTCLAGCCHASHVGRLHHHLLQVRGADTSDLAYKPANIDNVVSCLAQAHRLYVSPTPTVPQTTTPSCILMPVQIRNVNTTDERPIEYALWEQGVPCYRCDWPDILAHTRLTPSRQLMYRPCLDSTREFEVSVIYFRAGFEPFEYVRFPYGKETRLRLEMSRSIKAPDFLTHLSTLKVVQQALNDAGTLEAFLPDSTVDSCVNSSVTVQTSATSCVCVCVASGRPPRFGRPKQIVVGNNKRAQC